MGQYYTAVIIDKDHVIKTFNPNKYKNGFKLMEHSWIGNNFIAAVLSQLINNRAQLYWIGDYAEYDDYKNQCNALTEEQFEDIMNDIYDSCIYQTDQKWKYDKAYVINHDKKCYIQLPPYNRTLWQICPVSLLTAVGNGKGGGDYFSEYNAKEVGTWAGDNIEVLFDLPEEIKSSMENLTDKLYFIEDID